MSIDYELTLAGDVPLERVAELIAPGAVELWSPAGNRLLSTGPDDEYGYGVSITSGSDGYYEAEDGGTQWYWEPKRYVDITFHMDKETLAERGRPSMLRAVAKILNNRDEDAALVLNSNWLLLTRLGGRLRKHNAADWYDEAYDEILPG
ncbi:SitI3 family protein [Micromonospora sp. NPDC048909]|uniref:SitI3 family protein n=1 Tax=Micromonospora sp. NPDC048909 TaxID=3155643 RepID=UPI0033CAD03E